MGAEGGVTGIRDKEKEEISKKRKNVQLFFGATETENSFEKCGLTAGFCDKFDGKSHWAK